jgi:hypothetical protein
MCYRFLCGKRSNAAYKINVKNNMKLKEITPVSQRCGIGACPAIFETDRGNYIIIGKTVRQQTNTQLSGRIGPNEAVVEIPRELLADLISPKI